MRNSVFYVRRNNNETSVSTALFPILGRRSCNGLYESYQKSFFRVWCKKNLENFSCSSFSEDWKSSTGTLKRRYFKEVIFLIF